MMQRHSVRVLGACMAVALVVFGGIAEAGWRHWGSSGGSHGSSGGSYGSSGGSHGSSGGSHGSSGGSYGSSGGSHGSSGGSYGSSGGSHGSSGGYGWHGRWHARHSSHGSSGGSYSHASHGSSGGSSGGSYGSYGSHGSHGSYGGSAGGHVSHGYATERVISDHGVSGEKVEGYRVIDDRPAANSETIKTPVPAAAGDKTSSLRLPADAGMLVLHVPQSGKVFINGTETKAGGSVRRFVSRGLKAGEKYDFQVRVVADENGAAAEQVKVVTLSAGEQREVEFAAAEKKQTGRTALTLRVPAGAKVWLAGKPTAASGTVRRFETEALKPGERWSGYEVRVVTTEAGKEKVARKVIDLVGGESMQLALRSDELHADEGKATVEQSAGSSAPVSGVASIR